MSRDRRTLPEVGSGDTSFILGGGENLYKGPEALKECLDFGESG